MTTGYRLTVPPLGNPAWADVVTRPLYDADQCADLIATLRPDGWAPAALAAEQSDGVQLIDRKLRSAELQLLPDRDLWHHAPLMEALAEVNSDHHRYDLVGLDPVDSPAVVRYSAGTNDHFRPHQDVGAVNSTRKVTFVVQLTDPREYRGGDLLFPDIGTSAPREQGTLIVFPSFLNHVVSPLVSGTRHAIVCWLHGPTFS